MFIILILISCNLAQGLRPSYVQYRRQEATTIDQSTTETTNEASIVPAVEPNNTEKETEKPDGEKLGEESLTTEKSTENSPIDVTNATEKESEIPLEEKTEVTQKETLEEKPEKSTETPEQQAQSQTSETSLNESAASIVTDETSEPPNGESETAAPSRAVTDVQIELTTETVIVEVKAAQTEQPENDPEQAMKIITEIQNTEQKLTVNPDTQENEPEKDIEANEEDTNNEESTVAPEIEPRAQDDQGVAKDEPIIAGIHQLAMSKETDDPKDIGINIQGGEDNQVDDSEIKNVITKYFNSVPDVNSQYVINEGLAKSITHYFKNKVVALPLFNINLKIDRNLVKIPWEAGPPVQHKKKKAYPYRIKPESKKQILNKQ